MWDESLEPVGPVDTYWCISDSEIWDALCEVQAGVPAMDVYMRLHSESEWGDVV